MQTSQTTHYLTVIQKRTLKMGVCTGEARLSPFISICFVNGVPLGLLKMEFSGWIPETNNFVIQDGCLMPPQWNELKCLKWYP